MKNTVLGIFTLILSVATHAQDEDVVLSVAKQLFVAMETNDGKLAASLFTEGAQLNTVHKNKEGQTTLLSIPVGKLVEAFDKPKDVTFSELIWNERILIDGDYAVVWVDYAFYLGKEFSHCGVDMFQMILIDGEWKIFSLTDTRRKESCNVPAKIQDRFK